MSKLFKRGGAKQATPPETGGRITNETVAEHRERILAGGRKFKYPMQYTKHRVLLISVLIVVIATLSFAGFSALQLYKIQNTDKFIYRLTQAIPFPVAKVGDNYVRYSDYLRELRSSIHYFSTKEAVNFGSDDGKRQLEYQKRLALDKSIENEIVAQLAKQQGVTVSAQEVSDFVDRQVNNNKLGLSEEAFKQVIRDYYDWSLDEYKESIKKQITRKKVAAKLDGESRKQAEGVVASLKGGADFATAAKSLSEDLNTKNQGGDAGFFAADANDPNGLIAAAGKLQPGQVSDVIEGVDGFYIIKLVEKRGANELHIARIFISYKVLAAKIDELRKSSEVKEFIYVAPIANPARQ